MPNTRRYEEATRYAHMTTGSAINRSTESKLHRVVVNGPTAQTLTLYEGGTAGGDIIGVIDCNVGGTYEYGVTVTGLTGDLSGTSDVTVIYQ